MVIWDLGSSEGVCPINARLKIWTRAAAATPNQVWIIKSQIYGLNTLKLTSKHRQLTISDIPCSDCTGHTGRKDGGPWHMPERCRKVGSKTGCWARQACWWDPEGPPDAGKYDSWWQFRCWAPDHQSVGKGQSQSGTDAGLHWGSTGPLPKEEGWRRVWSEQNIDRNKKNFKKILPQNEPNHPIHPYRQVG